MALLNVVRNIFLLVLLSSFTVQIYSQIPIGVKAGVIMNEVSYRKAKIEYPGRYEYSQLASFHFGLFTKVKIGNNLDFVPEFQFIQKWSSLNSRVLDQEIKLAYLEIPLLISYRPVEWFAVECGGSIGLNIEDNSATNNYNAVDAGAAGGLRFHVGEKFSVVSRYYYGLTPIGAIIISRGSLPRLEYDIFNQNFQFGLAYSIR